MIIARLQYCSSGGHMPSPFVLIMCNCKCFFTFFIIKCVRFYGPLKHEAYIYTVQRGQQASD